MSDRAPSAPFFAAAALCAALASCAPPPEARRDLPAPQAGAAPDLAPTASFDAPRAEAATRETELTEGASDLAARADRLRTETETLAAPLLTDAERERLAGGV